MSKPVLQNTKRDMKEANLQDGFLTLLLRAYLLPLCYPDTSPFFKISDVGANLCAHLNIARIVEILKFMVRNLTLSLQNFKFRRLTPQQDYRIKPTCPEHATNKPLNSVARLLWCKQLSCTSGRFANSFRLPKLTAQSNYKQLYGEIYAKTSPRALLKHLA